MSEVPPEKPDKRKMSAMISELAGGFVGQGATIDERQSRLNSVCSAWNMASATPELRQRQLDQYLESFRRFNPAASEGDLAEVRRHMETLIERKLQRFPEDRRQIVDAQIVPYGAEERIEIASATLH